MKKITLIRHAKSSWKDPDLSDHERPLNRRGIRSINLMGRRLSIRCFIPQYMISSPARRALDTALGLIEAAGLNRNILVVDPMLYLAGEKKLIERIRLLDAKWDWVALVGHNPGLTEAAERLSGRTIRNVPTCGIVEMHFDADDWRKTGSEEPVSFDFDFPKNR